MVLAPVEPAAQPGLLQQFPADHRHVAQIVVAHQVVRAVVRLVVRVHVPPSVLGDPVLVGVDHVRMLLRDAFRRPPQRVGGQHVVVVAQHGVFALRFLHGLVRVAADPFVFLSADHPQARVVFRGVFQHGEGFRAGARPVVQHRLEVFVALRCNAVQQRPQHARVRVVDRDHHADQPGLGRVFPLPLQLRRRRPLPLPPPVIGSQQQLFPLLPEPFQRVGRPVAFPVFPDPIDRFAVHSRNASLCLSLPDKKLRKNL